MLKLMLISKLKLMKIKLMSKKFSMVRSRCPDQCLRLGPDDINLYLGVTDRFSYFMTILVKHKF